jgi:hypothetical protein
MLGTEAIGSSLTLGALAAALWAVSTFLWNQYRDNQRKRLELFLRLRDYFRTSSNLGRLCDLIDKDEVEKIKQIDADDRSELPAFFEELGIIVKSRTLRADLVHYFFGYYVIKCWNSDAFWEDLLAGKERKIDPYWRLLRSFVEEMSKLESQLRSDPDGTIRRLRI